MSSQIVSILYSTQILRLVDSLRSCVSLSIFILMSVLFLSVKLSSISCSETVKSFFYTYVTYCMLHF